MSATKVNLPDWAKVAFVLKNHGIEQDPNFDLPPVTIAWKDGKPVIATAANQIDKALGLASARVMGGMVGPDAFTLACDTFFANFENGKEPEIYEGDLQKAHESGDSAFPIGQAIAVAHVEKGKPPKMCFLPYRRDLPSIPFAWNFDDYFGLVSEKPDGEDSGLIPEGLQRALEIPCHADREDLPEMFKGIPVDRRHELNFTTGAAFLDYKGYAVIDIEKVLADYKD